MPMQGELEGVLPPKTKSELRAAELLVALDALDVVKDRVKNREEELLSQMQADSILSVLVRDDNNKLHVFEREALIKLRHVRKKDEPVRVPAEV